MGIEDKLVKHFFGDTIPRVNAAHTEQYTKRLMQFRIFAFLVMTANILITFLDSQSYLDQIIYLTSIGFQSAYMFFILSIQYHFFKRFFPITPSKGIHIEHLIQAVYQLAFSLSLPITIMFWSVLMKDVIDSHPRALTIINMVTIHSFPLIFVSIDMALNTFDFAKKRILIVLIVGCIYMVINFGYTKLFHKVYPPIDWISIFSYILTLITLALFLLTYYLGNMIFRRFKKNKILDNLLTTEKEELQENQ